MHIYYLGHAGFVAEARRVTILIDPWFYPAFFNSWLPYPDNSFLLEETLNDHYDYLYISHEHEDHLDRRFLERLPNKDAITVICPNYRSGGTRAKLDRLGFRNFLMLGHTEQVALTDQVSVQMFLDTSHKEDSGLLIREPGSSFLDLNDCATSLDDIPKGINILACQYSGASWYPHCYDYNFSVQLKKVRTVNQQQDEALVRKLAAIQPLCYLPSAGPAAFNARTGFSGAGSPSSIFAVWPAARVRISAAIDRLPMMDSVEKRRFFDILYYELLPGQSLFHDATSWDHKTIPIVKSSTTPYREAEFPPEDRAPYLPVTIGEIEEHIRSLVEANPDLAQGDLGNLRIWTTTPQPSRFISTDWRGHITGGKVHSLGMEVVPEGVSIFVPEHLLRKLIDGETDWETVLLTMRCRISRRPDVYNSTLMTLLRYGHSPIQTRQALADQTAKDWLCR